MGRLAGQPADRPRQRSRRTGRAGGVAGRRAPPRRSYPKGTWGLHRRLALSSFSLAFAYRHSYAGQGAITLPLTLVSDGARPVDLLAKLATSSTYCIFQQSLCRPAGPRPDSGVPLNIATATGTFRAYGHAVTISVLDFEWEAVVYFAGPETFSLDVLDRFGSWIDCE